VRELLCIPPTVGELWINRCGAYGPGDTEKPTSNVWRVIRNMPHPKEYLPGATAFVMAGTPGWFANERDWYSACFKFDVPIWLIGVGGSGGRPEWVAPYRDLIKVATVRDEAAQTTLVGAGLTPRLFLDPAFHAPYFGPREKKFRVVLVYRRKREPKEVAHSAIDEAYVKVFEKFRDKIDCVTVHEPNEIAHAAKLLGVEPFFSHEYRRYADIYAAAEIVVGGRFHGAVPALASEGEAHLLYQCRKTEGLTCWDWLPVRVHRHQDWQDIELGIRRNQDDVNERIRVDGRAHRQHLAEALGGQL
jgi:hypothetical protein